VKVGEEYNVEITEVGNRGDGITRIKNFVVFVPNTKRGDKVRIRIKELRGNSGTGEVVGEKESEEESYVEEPTADTESEEKEPEESEEKESEEY